MHTGAAGRQDWEPAHKRDGQHHPGAARAVAGKPCGPAQCAHPPCGERHATEPGSVLPARCLWPKVALMAHCLLPKQNHCNTPTLTSVGTVLRNRPQLIAPPHMTSAVFPHCSAVAQQGAACASSDDSGHLHILSAYVICDTSCAGAPPGGGCCQAADAGCIKQQPKVNDNPQP